MKGVDHVGERDQSVAGDQALARLRFGAHERYREPRPIRDLLWDAAFWLVLILGMAWIVKTLLLP